MRPAYQIGAVLCFVMVAAPGGVCRAGDNSTVVDVVPALSEQFDTMLLFAGKPKDLWSRAVSLGDSLESVDKLDPLADNGKWMKSLAALAMMERAVGACKSSPEKWLGRLLKAYSRLAGEKRKYDRIRCVVSAIELQRGDSAAALVDFGKSLASLPKYCFKKMERLATKALKKKDLGRSYESMLLSNLCRAQEGLRDWRGLLKTAKKLHGLNPSKEACYWIAEALFEMGEGKAAEKFLKSAKKSFGSLPVGKHRDVFVARRLVAAKNDAQNNGRLALAFKALDDPSLVADNWSDESASKLKSPMLDEVYTQALLDDGFQYERAWKYASGARGEPLTDAFLGFRVGSGMAMMLHDLLSPKGSHSLNQDVAKVLKLDLAKLAKNKPVLAKRTGLVLGLMDVMAGKNAHELAKSMVGPVEELARENKQSMQAISLAFVVRRFGARSIDTWKLMNGYMAKRGAKLDPSAVSLLCLSAVENALSTGSAKALEKSSAWIEAQADMDSRLDLKLWRANLTAVRGLLLKGLAQTKQLQRAVDAYGSVLASAANAGRSGLDPQKLCNVGTSLATLMMQGGSLEQARGLMQQLSPLCKDYPTNLAVGSIMNIAAGDEKSMKDSVANLNKIVDELPSPQARLQALLWLGLVARANKDEKLAREHFSAASKLFHSDGSGTALRLAPGLRSMVAISSNMELSAGYERENPFRLSVDIGLGVDFVLFPPAAVDESKLAEFSK